jgi:hypothetical protein
MTQTTADQVEDDCRARMMTAMIEALRESQLSGPRIPRRFYRAANAGVVLGMADALVALLVETSAVPDSSAKIIADHIRTGVALRTSMGEA